MIGTLRGLVGVGALRAAQVLLGPLQLLSFAMSSLALPIMSGRAGNGRALRRSATTVSAALTAVSLAWTLALLAIPARLGTELLGSSWAGARGVMLAAGLGMVAICVCVGPALALKAMGRPGLLLRATFAQSALLIGLGALGAWTADAAGAAAGLAAAQAAGAGLLWLFLASTARGDRA